MIQYLYTVEIYDSIAKVWVLENRYYHAAGPIADLTDVPDKRRNVTYIGEVEREYTYSS